MKKITLILVLAALFSGCEQTNHLKTVALEKRIDSLESIIDLKNYSLTLMELGFQCIDSYDMNYQRLLINLEFGISEADYILQVKGMNYQRSLLDWIIDELEQINTHDKLLVERLKREMSYRDRNMEKLTLNVALYLTECSDTNEIIVFEKTTPDNKLPQKFNLYDEECDRSEAQFTGLLDKLNLTRAEILYARGAGMEQVAENMPVFSQLKMHAFEGALQCYRSSLNDGYEPAVHKINALKAKLNIG